MAIEGPIIQGSGQPLDSDLTSLAATGTAANKTVYTTSAHVWAETDITAAGRAILDDANAGAQLTTLGVSAFAQTILDDADAQAVRTTLGNFYRYQLPEVFYKDNLAASTTNNDFQRRISSQGWVAPRAGTLVALTVKLNDTVTAGTVEFDVTVNGTESGSLLVTCTSLVNTTGGTATLAVGAGQGVVAGDVVGVSYTSDANLLPNGTIDAEAWVQVYEEAFVE